ncbi:MAG: hypothetical protein ABIJ24_05525 [Nitrospinota bacterium]
MAEEKKIINRQAYQQQFFSSVPTGMTVFMRNFVPWQILRFIAINIKMLKVISRSEHS